MRVVISVLSSLDEARQLTLELLQAGCHGEQILYLSAMVDRLDEPHSCPPGLFSVGDYRSTSLWCVREASYFSTLIRDRGRCLASGMRLLDCLLQAGVSMDWTSYLDYLDKQHPLVILQLPPSDIDEPVLARCVLSHAVSRLQVLDVDMEVDSMSSSPALL